MIVSHGEACIRGTAKSGFGHRDENQFSGFGRRTSALGQWFFFIAIVEVESRMSL